MNKPGKDLAGEVFGNLTVIKYDHTNKRGQAWWLVQCSCGNTSITQTSYLKSGETKSCGCLKRRGRCDIIGKRFGRLSVIKKLDKKDSSSSYLWLVKCDCGNIFEVRGYSLISNHTQSCGCLQKERVTKHGLKGTKEYSRTISRRRKEREKALDSVWTPLMEICLRDFQPCCVVCKTTKDLATDHVIPLTKGGGLCPGNAVTLCKRHNSMKGNKSLDQLPVEMAIKIKQAAESFRIAWSGGF